MSFWQIRYFKEYLLIVVGPTGFNYKFRVKGSLDQDEKRIIWKKTEDIVKWFKNVIRKKGDESYDPQEYGDMTNC